MAKRKRGEKAQEPGTGTGKAKSCNGEKPGPQPHVSPAVTSISRAPVAGGVAEPPSFSPEVEVGGGGSRPPLVPQAHGGALLAGGIPGHPGARVQQRRRERSEAIKDAVTGHIERLSEIMGRLVEEAEGEQYRCACGLFGP